MKEVQVLIVGRGPAGLSAAIYASRAGASTVTVGMEPKIGQEDYPIDNYFGFTETIQSRELLARGVDQAKRFGAEIVNDRVLGIHMDMDGSFIVHCEHHEFKTDAVVMATGVVKVKPGVENIDDYEGKGVSYCVSCDGFFYREKKVAVLGEGVYAANQALELTSYTPDVTIITQGKQPAITDDFLTRLQKANIPVVEAKIQSLEGEPALERAVLEDGSTMDMDGLFVALGDAGSTDFAKTLGLQTERVYIVADEKQHTNVPGVFAAGDCTGLYPQIAVAVGEGAKAARAAVAHSKRRIKL